MSKPTRVRVRLSGSQSGGRPSGLSQTRGGPGIQAEAGQHEHVEPVDVQRLESLWFRSAHYEFE